MLIGEGMRALVVFAALMFWLAGGANSANLYSGQALYHGQSISSDDGRYALVMQGDGNLVYYRTADWSARWNTGTQGQGGYVTVLQNDGNLVVYNSQWVALWNSGTQNHPGVFLAAQTDGNLAIYYNGQAIWHIGADTPDPVRAGDVVGRQMENNMPYAFLGHIALFDGQGGVYEVLNDGKPNATAYNALSNFKTRAYNGYWGASMPNIPDYLVKGCWNDYCGNTTSEQITTVRWGYVLRAFQILTIGSEYTYLATYTSAYPRDSASGARQGVYRCDTYVLDIFATGYPTDQYGSNTWFQSLPENHAVKRWVRFKDIELRTVNTTPLTIFNKLKEFAG
jgi:hypothetical protein